MKKKILKQIVGVIFESIGEAEKQKVIDAITENLGTTVADSTAFVASTPIAIVARKSERSKMEQLNKLLEHLDVDMTFMDKADDEHWASIKQEELMELQRPDKNLTSKLMVQFLKK